MFHYPLLSAVVGSGLNLVFLSVLIVLSWWRFFSPPPPEDDLDDLFAEEDDLKARSDDLGDEVKVKEDDLEEDEIAREKAVLKKVGDGEEDFQILSKGVEELSKGHGDDLDLNPEAKVKDWVEKKLD